MTLPEKIKKKQFTREEQVVLAGRLRESVILDAADEAIYKASRRASYNLTPLFDPQTPSTFRSSMESCLDPENKGEFSQVDSTSAMAAAMYESFRWMDEEDDLDLKLVLDDYHANLDGVVIPTPHSNRRPSFRRQMSISKMPFGRASLSSPRSPKFEPSPLGNNHHNRQKSRALSLIAPKHMTSESVSSIDPNATHYQDPEARLKLRVYLASPQKFDEAIEFGFPSINGVTDDKENRPPNYLSKDQKRVKKSISTEKSFLNDDKTSLFDDDDVSMNDPDSPITPMGADLGLRLQPRTNSARDSKTPSDLSHLGINKPTLVKQPESYTQAMAGNREMTLRMTLTRPDLRADETLLYGWQATKSPLREGSLTPDDDDVSMNDPDSPITPLGADLGLRLQPRTNPARDSKTSSDLSHLGISKPTLVKQPESYTQAMAGNREMTLRMTLTRPDLRADETLLYGWQASKSPLREGSLTPEDDEKYAVKGPFGGSDGWGALDKEDGVVKRFWNKVKSTQRKTS